MAYRQWGHGPGSKLWWFHAGRVHTADGYAKVAGNTHAENFHARQLDPRPRWSGRWDAEANVLTFRGRWLIDVGSEPLPREVRRAVESAFPGATWDESP